MSTQGDLPAGVQSLIPLLPVECQLKITELHGKFIFDDDQLDAFVVNHGKLNADNLKAFEAFLEQERATTWKASGNRVATPGDGRQKRKSGGGRAGVQLPAGLGAALGRSGGAAVAAAGLSEQLAATPAPKRSRDAQERPQARPAGGEAGPPASGTPDPPSKPLQVSLKCSMNSGNVSKPNMKSIQSAAQVELLGDSKLWTGPRHGAYAWVDESLEDRAAARDSRLASMEAAFTAVLCKRDSEEEIPVGTIGVPAQSEVVLCGRILCEGLEGRLNERSLLLEGSRASAGTGARVQLNVAECKHVAAFPGQIVGVLGRSGMSGTSFHAREFLSGLPPPPAITPAGDSALHMMVMSGPFCLRDGLDYTPLEQALKHVVKEQPQVLVLLGPFVDAGNQKVAAGEPILPGEKEPCTFEEVYTQHVLPMLARGLQPLRRLNPPTEVLIVPSIEEVLCFHPLPQPPLDAALGPEIASSGVWEQFDKMGVRLLPNPAHVNINGLRVSLTSTDALSPILREIVLRPEGRKIDEALRLLLRQRTLFPVVPREPAQVSEARAGALDFPDGDAPDVCIFPSVSGTATGLVVDETVVVNPGSICRPAALGTFAEFLLMPAAALGGAGGAPLQERARVDIQKLDYQKPS